MSKTPRELWTWDKCKEKIRSLTGRLGFPDEGIIFLGFEVDTDDGSIYDKLTRKRLCKEELQDRFIVNTIYYILSAYSDSDRIQLKGNLITSKQFRGVGFTERDNSGERFRIIREFGEEPIQLFRAVEQLEGSTIDFPYGDIAVRINSLPLVPITITITEGDEEFPSDARIFYDESVKGVLDSEQTYFLTHLTISRMIESKLSRKTD